MARALEYAEGFKLIFARCNQPDQRRKLIANARRVPPTGMAAELVLAADQFIITPSGRVEEAARARAAPSSPVCHRFSLPPRSDM